MAETQQASVALPSNNRDLFNALRACGAFGAETSMPAAHAFTRTAHERKDLSEDLWVPLLRRLVQALAGSSDAPLTASAVARVLSKLGCSVDDARLQLSGQTRGAGAYTRLLVASLRLLEWFAVGEPEAIALAPAQGLLAQPDQHRRQVASALSSCAEAKKQFSTEARRAAAARRDAKFGLTLS